MLKESLLAAALALPAWHGDKEEPEARKLRLEVIAAAIDEAVAVATCQAPARAAQRAGGAESPDAAQPSDGESSEEPAPCRPLWSGPARQLAFLLLGQAWFESNLAQHVHAGQCRTSIGECDSGRATSLWQLQAGYHLPVERWSTLSGTDLASTRDAAVEAARMLGRSRNLCGTLEGTIASYATGKGCSWSEAAKRASFVQRLMVRH